MVVPTKIFRPSMGQFDLFPAGYEIRFGNLEFQPTSNGYLMRILNIVEIRVVVPVPEPVFPLRVPRCRRRSGKRSRQARPERRRAARASSSQRVEAGEPSSAAAA
jgi:hypothetical protein